MKLGRTAASALGALLTPEIAAACSVCFSGRDETRAAFLATTVLLSALPLAMVGSLVFWLYRRSLALERQGRE
jgi:hypothetical protein